MKFLAGLLLGMVLGVVGVTATEGHAPSVYVPAPQSAFSTAPGSGQAIRSVSPSALLRDDSGAVPVPSPVPSLSPAPPPSSKVSGPISTRRPPTAQPSVAPSFGKHRTAGLATWYDDGPGLYAAAGPSLRRAIGPHWRDTIVTVCSRSRCADGVILSDWCACGPRNGRPTALDLSLYTFSRLSTPGRGVIEVIVSW